jgi:hypothetical protein
MSCKKCASGSKVCGCKDSAYTTPVATTCLPACPPRCSEYMSAACIVLSDGINDLGIHPGETLDSILQRIAMILTNPLCVEFEGGFGVGIGNTLPFAGNGIVEVGVDVPTNIFVTPVVPVTTPGGNLNLTLQDQPANTVFAGPASGADDVPQFRALVTDDLPSFTTGTSVLMGDGAGKFTNVTIGPNLSFAGGILDADINVVVGADNGLSKNPLNPDEVWLGGTLLQNTAIDGDTNTYSFTLSALTDFIVETDNTIYFKTESATDKTELFYDQTTAVFQYTDSISAIETAYSGISGINSITGIQTAYGDAYISIEKGVTDNQILVHTPKIDGGTAVVNQVLTLKAITGEAEWENVIATISASEGLITDPLVPDDVQLGGPSGSPAIFTQDRFIDNDGYLLKLATSTGPAQVLELENSSNSSTALKINQLSGDLLGRAIDITANGTGLLVDSQTAAIEAQQVVGPSYVSTVNDAGAVREVLNIRSPYFSSLPIIGYGAQLSFSLNDLISAGGLQYSSFITSSYTNIGTGTGATKLSLATKNTSDINPVNNLELLGTGQLVLNKYTSLSSFTGTSVGYLGFDASGNIITQAGGGGGTATAAEGLSIGAVPGQVELGYSTLSLGANLSTNRFINTGLYNVTLSGIQTGGSGSVLTVDNTAGTTNSTAIRASTNGTSGYAVYGTAGAAGATAIHGNSTSGTAVSGLSNSGAGVVATSLTGISLQATSLGGTTATLTRNQTNNLVEDVLRIVKLCSGTAAVGIGSRVVFTIEDDSGNANTAGSVTIEYTDVTSATRDALLKVKVVNSGSELTMVEVGGAQTVRLPQNLPGPYVDDTAASAGGVPQYALYIDASSTVKLCQI